MLENLRPLLSFSLGFFLGFSIEVKVHAREVVQLRNIMPQELHLTNTVQNALQEPSGCIEKKIACSFQVQSGRKLTRSEGGYEWTIAAQALIVREQTWSSLRLIEGVVRIRDESSAAHGKPGASGPIIDTPFAKVVLPSDTKGGTSDETEVYLEMNRDALKVINVGRSTVQVLRTGFSKTEDLGAGFEVEISKPDTKSGVISASLPLPLNLEDQVIRESRFFEGAKEKFFERVEGLASLRTEAAERASAIHEAAARRKIASVEKRGQETQAARERREARDRELRKMFRRKVLDVQ